MGENGRKALTPLDHLDHLLLRWVDNDDLLLGHIEAM